jgi:hypothetical protein
MCQFRRKNYGEGVAQVVERLPSKCEALSSNPSATKKKLKKKKFKKSRIFEVRKLQVASPTLPSTSHFTLCKLLRMSLSFNFYRTEGRTLPSWGFSDHQIT